MARKDEVIPIDEAQKRKSKKQAKTDNTALNKQVMSDAKITIADVKQFISDATKYQEDYRLVADRSWAEIEKRGKDGKLFGGNDLYRTKRWTRFPLWWSCLKIRQPLTLARLPIPILKDTQGDDPFGRTACVIGERFVRSILKTFEPFPEFASANDDFLVTNFGWGRPFYRMVECEKPEKIRLQMIQPQPPAPDPSQDPNAQPQGPESAPPQEQAPPPPPMFLTPDGQMVDPSKVQDDDLGPYLLTGADVTVEEEEVYWEAGLYADLLVDPDIRKWNKVSKLAFRYQSSYREFREKFGQAGLDTLSIAEIDEHKKGKPIIWFEYWDKFLREVYYCADNAGDFIQPLAMIEASTDELKKVKPNSKDKTEEPVLDNSDLYGLSGFFPCTEPLSMNQSTKQFWPTPEYFQVQDMIDYVHECVGRMVQLSKAVRVRFFFDSSVTELKTLIGENWAMGEGTGIGIPDLETTLMNAKGNLSNLVAYFPVEELLKGLETQYGNFQRGLDMFYQITGLSDLIRGQTNPDSDKTFGERQMEGKYALNRIEPFQNKVQEWIKDQYQLMMEMGFKMFRSDTVDEYVTPQTLDEEDKQRYIPSLELLKDNKRRRFRMDFETDSTIAINEEWKKSKAIETANVISKMIESTANVVKETPEIGAVELKLMQHVVGDLVDGKLFIDEIQEAIQEAIDKAKEPKDPEPDAAMERVKLDGQIQGTKLANDDKFRMIQLQTSTQLEYAKLQQKSQQDQITNQLKQIQMQIDQGASQEDLQLAVTKLQADIAQGWEELSLKKEALLSNIQAIVGKKEMDSMRLMLDQRVAAQEMTLAEAEQALRAFQVQLEASDHKSSLDERWATEKRLQEEHGVNIEAAQVESITKLIDAVKPEPVKAPPISIDLSKTLHVKPQTPSKPKKGAPTK